MWYLSSSKLTRVLAGAALLVFSAGCGSAESGQQTAMYADVSSSVASSTFELAEVSLGTISRNTSGEGVVIYPDSEYITCAGYEGTTLVQVNVKNGDSVEAGDVIAEFSRVYSQADLDTMYSDLSILKTQANIQRTALEQAVDRAEEQLAAAKELGEKLEKATVTLAIKAGEGGRAFGSVSSKEIGKAIQEQLGLEVDKKKIVLNDPIKSIGSFEVPVKLHKDVTAKLAVKVVEA